MAFVGKICDESWQRNASSPRARVARASQALASERQTLAGGNRRQRKTRNDESRIARRKPSRKFSSVSDFAIAREAAHTRHQSADGVCQYLRRQWHPGGRP